MFAETSMLNTQSEFQHSCNLMELDVTGNTTLSDINSHFIPISVLQDGVTYYQRGLTLSVEYLSGNFMYIEQIEEYTG